MVVLTATCAVLLAPGVRAQSGSTSDAVKPLRVVFAASMFSDINGNDAKASVKAWAQQMADEMDVKVAIETRIESDLDRLRDDFAAGRIECMSLTTAEYLRIESSIGSGHIMLGEHSGSVSQQYILVVSAQSPYRSVSDLKGATLTMYENPRTCLAPQWLDLLLAAEGRGGTTGFFSSIESSTKLSQAVLPVFFGQADACLVTRTGFDLMVELNPQVGTALREIARSPEVVPMLVVFSDGVDPEMKRSALQALRNADKTASGRQLLTLFQTSGLRDAAPGCFDAARAIFNGTASPSPTGVLVSGKEGAN
jgi:phosphonate transport system substrate-binding protein